MLMKRNSGYIVTACVAMLALAAGCGAKRPVLYPNAKLQEVGEAQAKQDIEACRQLASEAGLKSGAAGKVAGQTALGAGAGAAVGAVAGAITGHAGRGAAVGAGAGGTSGLLHGLFRSREPDPVEQGYVDQCLRDKGYQPIGWR
ncbi:MAG: glycine zipper family protein [bacterium]